MKPLGLRHDGHLYRFYEGSRQPCRRNEGRGVFRAATRRLLDEFEADRHESFEEPWLESQLTDWDWENFHRFEDEQPGHAEPLRVRFLEAARL